ncbi:MAG: hypothetical protein ACMZI0_10430 [Symbiopectobacterium sp.]|uniref:hypothetical protein n=1 Tax=Symbiopectobacterium sp. TaxID=2952789 RepID=UPI0039E9E93F
MMSKELKLNLHPSNENPSKLSKAERYLITNNAAYYNVVVSVIAESGDFLYFQGWDNGQYETFTPDMYQYWAELPNSLL